MKTSMHVYYHVILLDGRGRRVCRLVTLDSEDEDVVIQPEMLFNEDILAAVGGGLEGVSMDKIGKKILSEMSDSGWMEPTACDPFPYMEGPYEPQKLDGIYEDYPRLYKGPFGPTKEALSAAETPSEAPFFFMTPQLWDDVALSSNSFFVEKLDERVEGQLHKQITQDKKKPGYKRETKEEIRNKVEKLSAITAREICVFIGLLISRTISPNKEKLQHYWKLTEQGAIPRGCFGRFVSRDRFSHTSHAICTLTATQIHVPPRTERGNSDP